MYVISWVISNQFYYHDNKNDIILKIIQFKLNHFIDTQVANAQNNSYNYINILHNGGRKSQIENLLHIII